jgi:hypothetical protein
MAASIPILRALIRDTRPPAGPAEFYHEAASNMYTGTTGTRGTGRTSTTITSESGSRMASRASTRWSKDFFEGGGGGGGGPGGTGGTALLGLKRWSQMSLGAGHHRRGSSAVSALSQSQGTGQAAEVPPPGRILTTEEVVVEYEKNEVWIGKAF